MASSSARFWPYASDAAGAPGAVGEPDLLEQLHGAVLEPGHPADRAPPLLAHAGGAGERELEVLRSVIASKRLVIWKERAMPSGAICSGAGR